MPSFCEFTTLQTVNALPPTSSSKFSLTPHKTHALNIFDYSNYTVSKPHVTKRQELLSVAGRGKGPL